VRLDIARQFCQPERRGPRAEVEPVPRGFSARLVASRPLSSLTGLARLLSL